VGLETGISWTDYTWNPWQGCTKISPACANCYMFPGMWRWGKDPTVVRRSSPQTFNLPLKRKSAKNGGGYAMEPGKWVFTCSWSDWFHKDADPWRDEAWAIVRARPDLNFQIVTKRTERIKDCLPSDWGDGYRNVILIATVENQEFLEKRVPDLFSVPAWRRGLSCEPLLGPLDFHRRCFADNCQGECGWPSPFDLLGDNKNGSGALIDWIITGGESGTGARPSNPQWFRDVRDQCFLAGVPFHHKQNGEWVSVSEVEGPGEHFAFSDHRVVRRVGVAAAGRTIDGKVYDAFPSMGA